MTPLLFLTAALVLLSGLVKLRAWGRVDASVHVLPLLEIGAGVLMGAAAVTGATTPRSGFVLVGGGVVLVLVSSLLMAAELRRRRRLRDESEGARLVTYVKYLSEPPTGT